MRDLDEVQQREHRAMPLAEAEMVRMRAVKQIDRASQIWHGHHLASRVLAGRVDHELRGGYCSPHPLTVLFALHYRDVVVMRRLGRNCREQVTRVPPDPRLVHAAQIE